jgi:hypothetical protein
MDPVEECELEKPVWTHDDFDVMGWHDATIWAMAVISDDFELLFDIDYILRWVHPIPPEQYFSFWVSPATLVFEGAQNINVDVNLQYIQLIEVADINRDGPFTSANGGSTYWKWVVELQHGKIEFEATGFTQYFRKRPEFGPLQGLGLEQRGGLSFSREHLR